MHLRVITGGLYSETHCGPVRIVAAPWEYPPFRPAAIVFEEDTYLVLSAAKTVRQPDEHIVRTMTSIMRTLPIAPGTVWVEKGTPLRLRAIVHDLDCEPSWREEWIAGALENIFVEMASRHVASAALPLLGSVFGGFEESRFIRLLAGLIQTGRFDNIQQLWMIVARGRSRDIIQMFEKPLISVRSSHGTKN